MNVVMSVFLLMLSNLFMTFAWYGHLKTLKGSAWFVAVMVSWSIAFFEQIARAIPLF